MLTFKMDTTEFDKVFKEYSNYSKRSFAESCNQHAFYIARNAVNVTKAADKNTISSKLSSPARKYPGAPLAAILVNAELGNKGKKGLSGPKMATAISKYIKRMQSHVNFVRSGWIPAIKKLRFVVPNKGGTPIPSGTDKPGRNFGGAQPAIAGLNPTAYIWNSIWGSKKNKAGSSDKIEKILQEGAQKAVDMETQSMRDYIVRKQKEIIKQTFG